MINCDIHGHDAPDGREFNWVNEVRYLGVGLTHCAFPQIQSTIDQAKRSFYRAANGIFAKVGRLDEEVVHGPASVKQIIYRSSRFFKARNGATYRYAITEFHNE